MPCQEPTDSARVSVKDSINRLWRPNWNMPRLLAGCLICGGAPFREAEPLVMARSEAERQYNTGCGASAADFRDSQAVKNRLVPRQSRKPSSAAVQRGELRTQSAILHLDLIAASRPGRAA